MNTLQVIALFSLPGLILFLEKKSKIISFFGTVVWCYFVGIVFGNLFPSIINKQVINQIVEGSVLLAVPLLLFSLDIKSWLANTRSVITSFIISLVSICLATFCVTFFFRDVQSEAWKIGGMLVGVYSGGTVNMSAIGKALGINNELFLLVNAADIFVSSFYMIFVLTIAKKVLAPYFPEYQFLNTDDNSQKENNLNVKDVIKSFLLALSVAGISVGLSLLMTGKMSAPIILLSCTTLGVVFSFSPKIQQLKSSFVTGEYFIYIFCLGLGAMCDFNSLAQNATQVVLYVSIVLALAIGLHFFGAKIFKIDIDTALITNVASVFGPAFVAPVAKSMNNKEVIVSGLTCGLMGYAIGNYLGLAMAQLIKISF
ncbi:MAG: DUF819 family protein [Oligoflexia bacterium]|nr:DUF819 family protein [Oligoflexia bacterium]